MSVLVKSAKPSNYRRKTRDHHHFVAIRPVVYKTLELIPLCQIIFVKSYFENPIQELPEGNSRRRSSSRPSILL